MIPILDLTTQYESLKPSISKAIEGVLESGVYINGPNVRALEEEIAAFVGAEHGIALNSGTDALHLALRALGIGPGDEVITTPFTFVATSEAIGIVGARPVFVDIDPETFNINPLMIEPAITQRTRAILPVHLYGRPAPMPQIMATATKHGLAVIEDCAQAIGASIDGRKVGTFGDVGCFSFFPSKNLGAFGDGGMATTNCLDIAERMRSLRAHGGRVKYHHEELGFNSRLDELQAAILRVKLPHLNRWIERRREHALWYDEMLAETVVTPSESANEVHVYHQYTIRIGQRDRVQQALTDAKIQSMVYYPVPLHLQQVHRDLGYAPGSFPHSERASEEVLSLPMFPELNAASREAVIAALGSVRQTAGAV
jgi:dTDP-4-amino-4,6-dideoxygalactose transaminase